ncbi:sialidase family protein [Alicyclobacillus dauci]|uniref:Glycoside hydrolase n=1 Tax=Alicyclobacillus dauci TaxID=1475485 RepID=A0ABY6Z7G4_9BACL|nr:sialidase family protein [Alicyclobacillus dauci]WAH38623.1 glycoside hydrolase [Alicyclobacillus dauci]
MGTIAQYVPKDPQPLNQSGFSYVSDNGEINATFTKDDSGNNVVQFSNVSTGAMVSWYPQEIKYTDDNGLDDIIYSADNTSDLFVVRQFHARYDRHFPDVEEYWRVEAGQLKHFVTLTGDQRDPAPYLTNPKLAVGGIITFDQSFSIRTMGMTMVGDFTTGAGIDIVDGNGNPIFTLPAIEAWDQSGNKTIGSYVVTDMGPGQIYVAMAVDNAWISQDSIVYPVVIDPTTIVSGNFDISAAGGRKIVQLSNGWIVVAIRDVGSAILRVYVSKDNGNTWSLLTTPSVNPVSWAIASNGNSVYLIACSGQYGIQVFAFDATTVPSSISTAKYPNQNESSQSWAGCSIAVDGNGYIWVAWSDINPTFPQCYNIRAAKSTDGGNTWQWWDVTNLGTSGDDSKYPSLAIGTDNTPVIAYSAMRGNPFVYCAYLNGSAWTHDITIQQTANTAPAPCLVCDKNNIFHCFYSAQQNINQSLYGVWHTQSQGPNAWPSTPNNWDPIVTHSSSYGSGWLDPTASYDPSKNQLYVFYESQDGNFGGSVGSQGAWTALSGLPRTSNSNADPNALWSQFSMNSADAIRYIYNDSTSIQYSYVSLNSPPNAPTLNPVSNFDAMTAKNLTWQFSDPNSNDSQSAYQLQVVDVSSGSTVVDSGKVTSSSQSYALAANTLSNGKQYQWRVTTWDSSGAQGPWSNYSTFNTAAAPSVSFTSPLAGSSDNTSSVVAKWSYSDPGNNAQASYDLQLLDANNNVLWESGTVNDSTGNIREMTVQYTLANDTNYQLKIVSTNTKGITSAPATTSFSTSFTPPAPAAMTATPDSASGRISFAIFNPAPTGSQPAVSGNDIYRRTSDSTDWTRVAEAIPSNSSWTDYSVASGQSYDYKVTTYGTNGTQVDSQVITTSISLSGIWLHDPADPTTLTRFKLRENNRTSKTDYGQTLMHFEGRELPVADMDDQVDQQIQVTIDCLKTNGDLDSLRALIARKSVLLYRDGKGRKVYGVVSEVPETEQDWGTQVQLTVNAVDYQEAV